MTVKEKMHAGKIYYPSGEELMREQTACLDKLYEYNATRPTEGEKRSALLQEMFAEIGEGCYIEPPLRANWAGKFVHFGKNIYANFNLTLVDDTEIRWETIPCSAPTSPWPRRVTPSCPNCGKRPISSTSPYGSEETAG